MRSSMTFVLAVLSMMLLSAQEPSFEVASVKVSAKDEAPSGWTTFRPGQVTIHAAPLRLFLPVAFGVPIQPVKVTFDFNRVSRDLLERTYFDIQAKGSPTGDQTAMMQTLLRQRFGMKWHKEVRTLPLYNVTVNQPGKLGPWLKPSSVDCRDFFSKVLSKDQSAAVPAECLSLSTRGASMRQTRSAGTSSYLVTRLQQFADLPLIDATGLKGTYSWDFVLPWTGPSNQEFLATFRDALKDDLGLTLTRTTGPWEVIVIDDIRMPTPN